MWRTLTYKYVQAAREDKVEENASRFSSVIVYTLQRLLKAWFPTTDEPPVGPSLAAFQKDVEEIYRLAVKWQDTARGTHCSFDYITFLPETGSTFSEVHSVREYLSPDGHTHIGDSHGTVLLPVCTGLKASSTNRVETGMRRSETSVVLKKAVII